jgi:RimJ/RimL family protein N-acetyltransferase
MQGFPFKSRSSSLSLDPHLLELTASEPLSLQEEYDMQYSWREDPKSTTLLHFLSNSLSHAFKECTFIILSALQHGSDIDRMIGDVNVFRNDYEDPSRVELDIMIAEAEYQGKGCGKEAVLLMMWYCIHNLNISKFYCKISDQNHSSMALFRRSC